MREDFRKFIAEVRRNPFLAALVGVVFLLITSVSLLPAYRGQIFDIDPQKAGEFGDFIGGYFGPILSLIGIFFVVLTLREQRSTTIAERSAAAVEAFENRYYELLRLHRENVEEMKLSEISAGRTVFVSMMYELQTALQVVTTITPQLSVPLSFSDQLQLAYYCVFFGIGKNSSAALQKAVQVTGSNLGDRDFLLVEEKLNARRSPSHTYTHFNGHQSLLAHYYRHLFQMVSFVRDEKVDVIKKPYFKMIRAQLSNHEQALLLVNSLTAVGFEWWNQKFIDDHELVKNIPKGFMESYCSLDATDLFRSGYFEWQQLSPKPAAIEKISRAQG